MITFDPHALVQSLTDMTAALREGGEGAATVVQIQQGALQVKTAIGVSDYETGTPASVDQTFEIGSQTKMMTAVLILQLVEQGLIDLDAPAATYLPEKVVAGLVNADTATVRQLLNMTSGIPNYTDAVNADGLPLFIEFLLEHPDEVFGPEQALTVARDMDATGAPGESFNYSNTNYTLLGQIIEGLTGQTFSAALQDRIFDPAGMDASVRQLGIDDPRLNSYEVNPFTGETVNVTRAQWEMRGEAGVASTTGDMIAFVQALLVDRSLLGPDAMAQMMTYLPTQTGPGFETSFGLGLLHATFDGAGSFVGFAGGTLATESSTFLNEDTGMITSIGSTTELVNSIFAGLELSMAAGADDLWDAVVDNGGPVSVLSGSAAEMRLTSMDAGLVFALGGAALTLDRDKAAQTTDTLTFADGSVLVVGDNRRGTAGDDAANRIDILRDFAGAAGQDNQLIGMGGDDRLAAAAGNDALRGGKGADHLTGRGGEDRLFGGTGADVLTGGEGQDLLRGGAGADLFLFRTGADSGNIDPDTIADCEAGIDRIDLSWLAASLPGGLIWRGGAGLDGTPGALAWQATDAGVRLIGDLTGDGQADFALLVRGIAALGAGDLLL